MQAKGYAQASLLSGPNLKRCPRCQSWLHRDQFGTQSYCRPCHADYIRKRRPRRERQQPSAEEIRANARARSRRWAAKHAEKQKADRREQKSRQARACAQCGSAIPPEKRSDARYCSEGCMMLAARVRWIAANPEKHAAAQKQWRERNAEQTKAAVRRWAEKNPERRRHSSIRRRARKNDGYVEDVDRLVVLEKADGACGICGEDVDPMDYHVDHIVPLSRGGKHSYANSQAAHPACNLRKGHRLEVA